MKKLISLILLTVFLIWAAWYIISHANDFVPITQITLPVLSGLLVVMLFYLFFQAVILNVVIGRYGVKIPLSEAFGLLLVSFFANYLFPFSGIGVRAAYLQKVRFLPLHAFTAGLVATVLIELCVYAVGGLFGLYLLGSEGPMNTFVAFSLAGVIILSVTCFLLPKPKRTFRNSFLIRVTDYLTFWQNFAGDRRTVFMVCTFTILHFVAFAIVFWLAISVVAPASVGGILLSTSLTDFSFFIRIAPAAIGSFEAAIAFVGHLQGVTLANALIVAALVRGSMMFWLVLFGPYFFFVLLRKNDII